MVFAGEILSATGDCVVICSNSLISFSRFFSRINSRFRIFLSPGLKLLFSSVSFISVFDFVISFLSASILDIIIFHGALYLFISALTPGKVAAFSRTT